MDRSRINVNSGTWLAVAEWLAAERVKAVHKVLAPGLGPVETEVQRARIVVLDELARLPVPDRVASSLARSSERSSIESEPFVM
jgi:hypothetical protein